MATKKVVSSSEDRYLPELLSLLAGTDIAELEVEGEGVYFLIRRSLGTSGHAVPPSASGEENAPQQEALAMDRRIDRVLSSPWVGVFQPVVTQGEQITAGQVLGTVEALRMRHAVEAEENGVVAALLAQDGQAVEYGQPLVRITVGL